MVLRFGVFDHLDANGMAPADLYASRLELVECYDALGVHCYHVAEHHATMLGMAPSPGLFLAAVAQRTHRLRFGPLVYLLPLYHPLRLLEEIAMLDQMSGGRLQVGVGKGGQPAEHERFGLPSDELEARFEESLEILMKGMTDEVLSHEGHFYTLPPVPRPLRPLQQPHPPLWYGTGHPARAAWAAGRGMNAVTTLPNARARALAEAFGEALDAAGPGVAERPMFGVARQLVVAPTEAEALRIAERAWRRFAASFNWLVNWLGRPAFPLPQEFSAAMAAGLAYAGDPASVRDWIAASRAEGGFDYFLAEPVFGDMSHEEALQCATLYAGAVMPAFAGPAPAVA